MANPPLDVPEKQDKILIVGGYGQVGLTIAKILAPLFPDALIVSGRNAAKARQAAITLGNGAQGIEFDVFSPVPEGLLHGVALVLVCLDQADTNFVSHCLSLAINYVDISAKLDFLTSVETLDMLAKQQGASAVMSVGLTPGFTNMLARHAVKVAGPPERLDILVEFGVGDRHGRAAINWMFDNLDRRFEHRENGQMQPAQSFVGTRKLQLPDGKKPRSAYRFSFPDQVMVARTLDIASVSTWFRLNNTVATWLVAGLSRWGLARLLRRRAGFRRALMWSFLHAPRGVDRCGISVTLTPPTGGPPRLFGIIGRREAEMTAIITAETVRQIMGKDMVAGVRHSDLVIDFQQVIAALKQAQPDLIVSL